MIDFLHLYCFMYITLFLHEFGHAFMCFIFKKNIKHIKIGDIVILKISKYKLGLLPINGYVAFSYYELKKHQQLCIYLIGPIITFILLIVFINEEFTKYNNIIILQLVSQLFLSFFGDNSDIKNALNNKTNRGV